MSWDRLPPLSTYPKARRKQVLRRLGRLITGRPQAELLGLKEVQDRLRSYEQSYGGVRTIRVDDIVGSVSRTNDFDDNFLPRSDHIKSRWQAIEERFPDGKFPPICVYKVGKAYFVEDGHHRVAIAKQRGIEYLDAEITEVHTPYEITPDTDIADLVHLGQQRIFMQESGLRDVAPAATFRFTRPEGYRELLDHVKVHGWDMAMGRGEFVPREEIARRWYEDIYLPTVEKIEEAELDQMLEGTRDDIFLWVTQQWRRLFPEHGAMSFEEVISDAVEQDGDSLA